YKDFVTFTDEATRMSFVFYLLDKKPSTVLKVFEEFKERAELHFHSKGYKIKAVRMDGGSEYQATLKGFLIEKGIESDITTHYSPESNGISERLNRTLLDMARTMLFGANLPNKLWAEAVSTAVYLKNRLPHSSLRGDVTPHEMWFGIKPSLSHLRIFGCAAHVHVPEERRKKYADDKVSHRSVHTYFVRYDKSDRKIDMKAKEGACGAEGWFKFGFDAESSAVLNNTIRIIEQYCIAGHHQSA